MKVAHRTHGMTKTPTYSSWRAMLKRCENPKARCYDDYGGRGIVVCARWHHFEEFLADLGERPLGCSLDRINVDANYEPGNCQWSTQETQQRNTRRKRELTLEGETLSLSAWAERLGVSYYTLHMRLRAGWSEQETLTTTVGGRRA